MYAENPSSDMLLLFGNLFPSEALTGVIKPSSAMFFHTSYNTWKNGTLQFFVFPVLCPSSSTASETKARVAPESICQHCSTCE